MALQTLANIAGLLRGRNDRESQQRAKVVDLLRQTNEIFDVLPLKACNAYNASEVVPLVTDYPAVAWRLINRGTTPTVTRFRSVSFTCGGAETTTQIDEKLVQVCGVEFWESQKTAALGALSNKIAETIFYGDEKVNPAGFTGLSAYYYDKSDSIWGGQIIDAGGTGNNLTSIWFVALGLDSVYGIHPTGIEGGFLTHDNGLVTINLPSGEIKGYEYQYNWDMGLVVRDPKAACRIANIDTTALSDNNMAAFLEKLADAQAKVKRPVGSSVYCFMNSKTLAYLNKAISRMAAGAVFGMVRLNDSKVKMGYCGVPLLVCDAILSTESQI